MRPSYNKKRLQDFRPGLNETGSEIGKVYLVGAGPGDPRLLTLKGLKCLREADVIIYDRLAEPVIRFANKDAELIYVGKAHNGGSISQSQINILLLKKAKERKFIVRLKGGDPFIFGRGGEEAIFLSKENIPFEVVPGVSSAFSVPAYSGIPLTHRDYSSSVTVVSGQEASGKKYSSINWILLAENRGTLVFLMGAKNFSFIIKQLLRFGMRKDTPVAIIMNGTMPKQRTITGRLEDILSIKDKIKIFPPAVLVIGEVVKLRESLAWIKERPLFNKRVLITRPAAQAEEFENLLKNLGAEAIRLPTIKISPIKTSKRFKEIIKNLKNFDSLIFTSVNGVRIFFKKLKKFSVPISRIRNKKFFAIGPKTAREIERKNIEVSFIPERFTQEGLLDFFRKATHKNKKVLLINSKDSRPILKEGLEKLGLKVEALPIYETKIPRKFSGKFSDPVSLRPGLKIAGPKIDFITFTSPSTARNFVKMQSKEDLKPLLKEARVASIGPITTRALKELGIRVHIEAKEFTIEGLTEAICEA